MSLLRRHFRVAFFLAAGMCALLPLSAPAGNTKAAEPVRIGMIGTLFRDVPQGTVLAMMEPFGALMESQTGISGKLVPGGDADSVGKDLVEDKLQLAVFHGIEFAWARVKHPELRPLVIAINQQKYLRAHLLVRVDSTAQSPADLQGKTLALPAGTREHCRLFLQRRCQECGKKDLTAYCKVTTPPNAEEAIDDVIDGQAQATIIDGVSLDSYKRRKPGRFARVKILQTSEVFPAACVAYRPGTLDDSTLQRFRDGLAGCSKTVLGRQLLTLFKLTSFEPVPEDYEQLVEDIIKSYPPPGTTK